MEQKRGPVESGGRFGSLRQDFLASVVVFLVAMPLCMGIAIASGVPDDKAAAVGIISGIIGGLVVAPLAGCPLQVSGPAAGLSVIVFDLIREYGWERVGIIFLLAGLLQIGAGVFRLGQWFRAVSPAVIYGMLAGIGLYIFASQFHVMVDDKPRESGIENLISIPEAIYKGMLPTDDATHHNAFRLGILTILIIVLWKPVLGRWLKHVPAPLVAVLVTTLVAAGFQMSIKQVAVSGDLTQVLHLPPLHDPEVWKEWQAFLIAGMTVAFIASAETLLSATAVDQLQTRSKRTNYDRELLAQGVGNSIAGLIGALPITGVIVRSATNIDSGGRSRLSSFLHGLWLLLFFSAFPLLLRYIPTSALAAILVYTGYKLMDFTAVRELWKYGGSEVAIYAATVVTIMCTDLLVGVMTGVGLSLAKLIYQFSHLHAELDVDMSARRAVLRLEGTATFIRLPQLAKVLERVPGNCELHVDFERLSYIDHACLNLLINWEKQHEMTGGSLVLDWDSLTARFRSRVVPPAPPVDPGTPNESGFQKNGRFHKTGQVKVS